VLRLRRAAQPPSLLPAPLGRRRRSLARTRVAAVVVALALAAGLAPSLRAPSMVRAEEVAAASFFGTSPAVTAAVPLVAPAVADSAPLASSAVAAPVPLALPAASAAPAPAVAPGSPHPVLAVSLPRAEDPSPSPTPTPSRPPATGTLTPELSAALTKRLGELRVFYAIPGIEATIVFADGRSWRAHSGFQDYSARTPVQNATPFPVASVTKTFMAALVVQLAQEGRFGLDDRLVRYLPGANVNPAVTVRQLLDHTSGIADFFSNSEIDTAILDCRTCVWTPAKSLSYVGKQLFAPGTRWSYSNTNYLLLGQLVEAVTGDTCVDLLRTRFFTPLGLISTFVQGKEPAPYPVVHSYRFWTSSRSEKPTGLWDGTGVSPFRSLATAAGSAGDIASSARDLAVWARALYAGGVLGAAGSKAMLDFDATMLLRASIPYGLGVERFTVAGRVAFGHGGRLLGARSAMRYLPAEGMSIAVVINTDRGNPAAIANALAEIALPPVVPSTPSSVAAIP